MSPDVDLKFRGNHLQRKVIIVTYTLSILLVNDMVLDDDTLLSFNVDESLLPRYLETEKFESFIYSSMLRNLRMCRYTYRECQLNCVFTFN